MKTGSRSSRILAAVAILATLLVVLFSVFFVSQNVKHDCSGEDCPICAMMTECTSTLKAIAAAIVVFVAVVFLIKSQGAFFENLTNFSLFNSLIFQKVRLNI